MEVLKTEQVKELIKKASEGKANAYAVYSKFHVGAALLTNCGKIFTGCNMENAAYPVTTCAEKVAFGKAISEGYRNFVAIAVISDLKSYITPCGNCRQLIREFGEDILVYCCGAEGNYEVNSIKGLLPKSFGPEDLNH